MFQPLDSQGMQAGSVQPERGSPRPLHGTLRLQGSAARTTNRKRPCLQLLHGAVVQRGGVLPLAVALRHAEEGVEVKRLQTRGVHKPRRHLRAGQGRGAAGGRVSSFRTLAQCGAGAGHNQNSCHAL